MNIPAPLLDRMEVIRLPGYTEDEKVNIAAQYLVPKQIEANGLKKGELAFEEGARDIIRYYTREAGVRSLEREIAKICRKAVKDGGKAKRIDAVVTPDSLENYLGVRKFRYGLAEQQDQIGQVTGLAWTEVGGDLLTIEAAVVPGKGQLTKTGSLGDVMAESITAALTVVRSARRAWASRRTSTRSATSTSTCRKARRRRTARARASACARRWCRRSPRSRCAPTWR